MHGLNHTGMGAGGRGCRSQGPAEKPGQGDGAQCLLSLGTYDSSSRGSDVGLAIWNLSTTFSLEAAALNLLNQSFFAVTHAPSSVC